MEAAYQISRLHMETENMQIKLPFYMAVILCEAQSDAP